MLSKQQFFYEDYKNDESILHIDVDVRSELEDEYQSE